MSISIAAYRLAFFHGHAWAAEITPQHDWDFNIPKRDVDIATKSLDDEPPSPTGPGLYPDNHHVTGTGRVAWVFDHDGREGQIEIRRPESFVGGLSDGHITVLRAYVVINKKGLITKCSIQRTPLAEQRHWKVLFSCLQVLGLEDIGDYDEHDVSWDTCINGCLGFVKTLKKDQTGECLYSQDFTRKHDWNDLKDEIETGIIPYQTYNVWPALSLLDGDWKISDSFYWHFTDEDVEHPDRFVASDSDYSQLLHWRNYGTVELLFQDGDCRLILAARRKGSFGVGDFPLHIRLACRSLGLKFSDGSEINPLSETDTYFLDRRA